MEEAWELAAVSAKKEDFSAKHTRLRYQTVLSALVLYLACKYGVENLKVPGVLTFKNVPDDKTIIFAVLFFFIFTLMSFLFQTFDERASQPVYFAKYKKRLDVLRAFYQKLEPNSSQNLVQMYERLDRSASLLNEAKSEQQILDKIKIASSAGLSAMLSLKYHTANLDKSSDEFSLLFPGSESGWAEIMRTNSNLMDSATAFYDDFKSNYAALNGRDAAQSRDQIVAEIEGFSEILKGWCVSSDEALLGLRNQIAKKKLVRFLHKDLLSVGLPVLTSLVFLSLACCTYAKNSYQNSPDILKKLTHCNASAAANSLSDAAITDCGKDIFPERDKP